jgi:hypothetical protein
LNPRKLVTFPDYVGEVWVEPDAQRILLSQLQVVGDSRLFDIAADGTGLREIRKLSDDECNSCFIWTPDEKYLVYQFGSANHSDIWVLSYADRAFLPPGETGSTHEWTTAILGSVPKQRWKADFCSRHEGAWRARSFRHEVAPVPAIPLWHFPQRTQHSPGMENGSLMPPTPITPCGAAVAMEPNACS